MTEFPMSHSNVSVPRHSISPRFTRWPENPSVLEGDSLNLEVGVENCTSVILSRDFCPVSSFP